jgi:tRNA (guanine-N7-)-methyltransferase
VFVLFSDPWPKTRHHKRRFINAASVALLARAMAPGAELRMATDDRGYLVWMLEHMARADAFEWLARRPGDWRLRPPDWPATRYEQKAIAAGRECIYLRYRRRDPERVA